MVHVAVMIMRRKDESQSPEKVYGKILEKPLHSVNSLYENSDECGILTSCILVTKVFECLIGIINVQTYHLIVHSFQQAFCFTVYMIHIRTEQIQVQGICIFPCVYLFVYNQRT